MSSRLVFCRSFAAWMLMGCATSTHGDTNGSQDGASLGVDGALLVDGGQSDTFCTAQDPPTFPLSGYCTAEENSTCVRWAQAMLRSETAFGVCVFLPGIKACRAADRCEVITPGLAAPYADCHCGTAAGCENGWVCARSLAGDSRCVRPCSR